jgi:hypothetical protein
MYFDIQDQSKNHSVEGMYEIRYHVTGSCEKMRHICKEKEEITFHKYRATKNKTCKNIIIVSRYLWLNLKKETCKTVVSSQ